MPNLIVFGGREPQILIPCECIVQEELLEGLKKE